MLYSHVWSHTNTYTTVHVKTCLYCTHIYIYIYIYQANKALYQYNPKQPMHRMSQWPMGARNITQRACKRDVIHSNAMWQCCVVDCNRDVAPINGSKIFTKQRPSSDTAILATLGSFLASSDKSCKEVPQGGRLDSEARATRPDEDCTRRLRVHFGSRCSI
jgi:hypothetical protein